MCRNTQGVKLINVNENETVSKIAIVEKSEDEEETVEESEAAVPANNE